VWQQLAHCTQLHTLQMQAEYSITIPLLHVIAALTASAATLEAVSIGRWLISGHDQTGWMTLAQCQQLRTLSLTMQQLDWQMLLGALSQLPLFHTLGLFVETDSVDALPAHLLHHMTARVTSQWRTLQLHLLQLECSLTSTAGMHPLDQLLPPDGATSDTAAQQLRVTVTKAEQPQRSHIITADEHGERHWHMM